MSIRPAPDVASSEITPKSVYLRRRAFLEQALAIGLVWPLLPAQAKAADARKLPGRPGPFSTSEKKTSYKDVTTYNNFYEFGTGKDEPAIYAPKMNTQPWAVTVDGEVKRGGVFGVEELLKLAPMQERIYRHRCVEAWSMVIPWVGYPLAELIKRVEPTGRAKYVAFTTKLDTETMVGTHLPMLDWPYVESLRLDEAMHPLTLLTFGLYG
ncbi:MAG: protein-methionine-sulfoxide reductase catalytic subunit MsrP, partial [Steroidobacteraceae bacterium]